jgi:AraC-like DNA-binding protein
METFIDMKELCIRPNRQCVNYGMDVNPIVEILGPAGRFEKDVPFTTILYVLRGTVNVSHGTKQSHVLTTGDMMLFPPGTRLTGRTNAEARVMVIRVKEDVRLCDKYSIESLYADRDVTKLRHSHLKANPMIRASMNLLAENIENGLLCVRYMSMKMQELFFYLRAYYDDDELARFNLPLLGSNAQFMSFIWANYRNAHNVNQFAEMANSSLTTFKVRFKRVTGVSPSYWMAEQKARNVFHEISSGEKTLKQISHEYHFSSVSHLGTFCRKNFGQSPGSLKPGKAGAAGIPVRPVIEPVVVV